MSVYLHTIKAVSIHPAWSSNGMFSRGIWIISTLQCLPKIWKGCSCLLWQNTAENFSLGSQYSQCQNTLGTLPECSLNANTGNSTSSIYTRLSRSRLLQSEEFVNKQKRYMTSDQGQATLSTSQLQRQCYQEKKTPTKQSQIWLETKRNGRQPGLLVKAEQFRA